MTDPDYRALCAELAEALHEHTCLYEGHESELVARARALLAEPEPEGPTDEELRGVFVTNGAWPGGLRAVADLAADRARWGRPAAAPVPEPGEVAELVEWLKAQAIVYEDYLQSRSGSKRLTRAADLLETHALPTPEATND